VILQDFLELYSMPYAKIAAEKWHEMVKELAAGILKVNMEVSFEEKVIVFGANMRRYGPNVPLRFIVRPGRYMARVRGIAGREKGPVVQDSFIEDESDMIRGLIAGEIGNEDGFIRLNATSFEEPVFLLAQLKKLALFLIESGVSPGKDLVFTGKMTTFIEERLGARLPEELTLQEFVNFMATRKKMPGIVKKKGKEFSSVFGLPIRKKAMVDISKGIHNKTAAFIVEIASSFPGAKIYMRKGSRVASAHDRVELMHLAVGDGEDVEILAVGPGAQTAVEMIVHFLKDGTTATKDQILSELKHIFDKWRMEGVRLFQDLRYTHDIKSTKVLFHDLLYGSVNTGTRYELRYDVSRLSPAQVDLVKTYSRIFEEQLGYRDLITFKPFSGELSNKNTEDIPLFSVIALREKTIRGEGNVFVDVAEGDIEEYILRIPGLLNIVFAAANIETGLSEDEINNEYPALIGFIKTQCILILGEEHFSRDIVRDFRSIRLTLPKIYKHDLSAPIDEYNRETREILIKA
jgi:phosphotransferase system HPr (HPr) family protein